jgi:hypothetical protein
MFRHLGLWAALLSPPLFAADDRTPTPAKLKEIATEGLTKSDVKDGRLVETDHLIVASALPEVKAKAAAEAAEKMYGRAHKALNFEPPANPEPKMVVYLFPDVDNYRSYKRNVVKERAESDEFSMVDQKGDYIVIALSPRRGDKAPKFDVLAADEVGKALLLKKAGPNARVTEWMKDGFLKAINGRTSPAAISAERTAARRVAFKVPKGWKGNAAVELAWTGTGAEKDAVAATLMDFLTFGPGADKLSLVLGALVPTDEVMNPTPGTALLAPGWKMEELDYRFREWLSKGSPENKPADPKAPAKK